MRVVSVTTDGFVTDVKDLDGKILAYLAEEYEGKSKGKGKDKDKFIAALLKGKANKREHKISLLMEYRKMR